MNIVVALVHIGCATIWLGGAFFYTVVLQPKLGALDTAQQRVLSRSLRATMTPLLAVSAAATIASGLVMMVQLHHLHTGPFSHDRWGVALIIGAVASLGALAVAVVEARANRRDAWANDAPGRVVSRGCFAASEVRGWSPWACSSSRWPRWPWPATARNHCLVATAVDRRRK